MGFGADRNLLEWNTLRCLQRRVTTTRVAQWSALKGNAIVLTDWT